MINALPAARESLADQGNDSDSFRATLTASGITPKVSPHRTRKTMIEYNKALHRQSHGMENTFVRLKDWRRIATPYDRWAHICFSVISIAATVIFWLGE